MNFYKPNVIDRIPIRHKITITVVLMVLLPMSIAGFYFYSNISAILTKNAYNNLDQLIRQTKESIEDSFSLIDNTSTHFLSNKSIRYITENDISTEDDLYNLFLQQTEIQEELKYSLLFNSAWDSKLITTAYLFMNENTFSSISRSYLTVHTVDENNKRIYRIMDKRGVSGKSIIPPTTNDATIYFTRDILNLYNFTRILKLVIGTDENIIFQKYEKLLEFPGSKAYIIDNEGTVFSSSDKSILGKKVERAIFEFKDYSSVNEVELYNQKYLMAFTKIGDSGLTFVAGIPKKEVLAKLSGSMRNYLLITMLIVLAFLIVSIFISLRFTRFIRELLDSINKFRNGNYDARMPKYNDYELNLLSSTFNNMTGEIKHLINQVYKNELLLKETEIKFLQSQINPHFLFNVLVTIGMKARMSKDETIYKMVTSLSELLQASIYSSNKTKISVRQELEYIEFYLYLQKMRFEDKLEYKINISDVSILDCYLPRLSVEPIVENAVVHGLENKLDKGIVIVNVIRNENSVYFEIIDDGVGFDLECNKNLAPDTIVNKKNSHNSIGLNNTNRRIKLLYGNKFGINVESKINVGSKVIVHIPVDKGENSDV